MAKRKRASLKDKSPEALGLTQKKGKGMDLLFGGSVDKNQASISDQSEEANEGEGAGSSTPESGGPSSTSEALVDELGLPIALEAPPDDLILASNPAEAAAEFDNLATSPFAMPAAGEPQAATPGDEPHDLSGIMEEDNASLVEEEKVSSTEANNTNSLQQDSLDQSDLSGLVVEDTGLSGLVVETSSPATTTTADLSGLAMDDLSGLAATAPEPSVSSLPEGGMAGTPPDVEAPVAPAGSEQVMAGIAPDVQAPVAPESDLSGLAADNAATSFQANDFNVSASPQTTAAPINTPPTPGPSFQTTSAPESSPYTAAPTGAAGSAGTFTSPYAAPAPRSTPIQIDQAPSGIVNALSAFGQTATPDKFTPQDELPTDDGELVVKEVTLAERDDEITRQVMQYVGAERRDRLFSEIETLYGQVSEKLSGNKKDVNFALDTLRHAHNLILESPREYDEAFYRVAIVKTILTRKNHLSSWSYSWGLFVLLYGIIWLAVCMTGGYYIIANAAAMLADSAQSLSFQALFSGFSGGIGGSVAVLWVLYYRVSVKQDFDRQYLMFYLVKPILGLVLGLVMYFLLIAAGSISSSETFELGFETTTGVALAAFIGFIAGFRQDNVYDWIYVMIKTISPKAAEESQSKTTLVPPDIIKEEEAKQVNIKLS